MKTGTIRYNVRERGRQHRGADRNFDCAALAKLINGPEVQERVRKRDLHGFFGHWPRMVFGMEPGEGGILDGRQVTLEPAHVTTMLRADSAGNVEHEAEFLDTAPGRTAKRLWNSRAGGFSSAINVRPAGGLDVPIGFHGFDYVLEPNFSTNRGWALDGVIEGAADRALVLDSAVREELAAVKALDSLYTTLQAEYERQAETLARVQLENETLVAMVARLDAADQAKIKRAVSRLGEPYQRPQQRPPVERAILDSSLYRDAQRFIRETEREAPGFEPVIRPEQAAELTMLDRILQSAPLLLRRS